MSVLKAVGVNFDFEVPVLVIGAGACGLVAALASHDAGETVMVLERDERPSGSTSLSAGLIPAACTQLQKAQGIDDSPELFAADLVAKTHDRTPHDQALVIAKNSGPMIDWLMEHHQICFELVTDFLYPGHSRLRMHGPQSRTGADLEQALLAAVERAGIDLIAGASVEDLFVDKTDQNVLRELNGKKGYNRFIALANLAVKNKKCLYNGGCFVLQPTKFTRLNAASIKEKNNIIKRLIIYCRKKVSTMI